MSYCRWSDDNFGCDIYAYATNDGYQVHVKTHRRIGPLAVHPLLLDLLGGDEAGWVEAYRIWNESMDSAEHLPIGLPCDGDSYGLDDLEDLDAKLRELREMGYCFPDWVLDDIADEMAEDGRP